jgi:hypothetical protein
MAAEDESRWNATYIELQCLLARSLARIDRLKEKKPKRRKPISTNAPQTPRLKSLISPERK